MNTDIKKQISKKPIFYTPRARGSSPQITDIKFSDAFDGFTQACNARKLSENTIADYSRTLRRFLVHFGDIRISEITTSMVAAFLASRNVSEKSILNYHIGLSALWTWLIREGYTVKHIIRIVEKPRPKQNIVEPFEMEEVKAILNIKKKTALRDNAIIMLLLDTGIRASELCSLTFDNINLNRLHVKVLGKGNKERIMPISSRTGEVLFDYLLQLYIKGKAVKPFQLTRTSLGHLLQRIGKQAGVKKVHPHRFRHTFAINYLRNGGDPFTLQDILGHTEMEMVKRYLKLARVDIDDVHKRASPVTHWKL
jgi:integrase/recombinase XerD